MFSVEVAVVAVVVMAAAAACQLSEGRGSWKQWRGTRRMRQAIESLSTWSTL